MDTRSRGYKLLNECHRNTLRQHDYSTDEIDQGESNLQDSYQSSTLPCPDPDGTKLDNGSKVENWLEGNQFDQLGYHQGDIRTSPSLNVTSSQNVASGATIIEEMALCSVPQNSNIFNDSTIIISSHLTNISSPLIQNQDQISAIVVDGNNGNSSLQETHCVDVGAIAVSNLSNVPNFLKTSNPNSLIKNSNDINIESMEVIFCELKNVPLETAENPSIVSDNDSDFTPEQGASFSENSESASSGKEHKTAKKSKRKLLRNTGDTYTTASGKNKRKRTLQPLQPCRNKCEEKLDEQIREYLFSEYWSLGSHDKRTTYVANLINIETKKIQRMKEVGKKHKIRNHSYTYNFKYQNQNIKVCKTCFLKTLDETQKFVQVVMKNKLQSSSGTTHSDLRGKHAPANKLDEEKLKEIRDHILSFPAYESHYSRRHTSKKYLGSHLNLTILYDLYCDAVTKPVCRPIYVREFHKLGLRFKKPAIDTCTTCDKLAMTLKNLDDDVKAEEELKLRRHHEEADLAYDSKKQDKDRSKIQQNLKVYTFDLQQVLPTPFLTSGNVFYKRQLSTYNLTIHDCTTGNSHHYMWHEAVARRGSNEISSCLYHFILNVIPADIEHAIFYSDTCGGQNKNSTVIAMFSYVLNNHPTLQTLEHKFLTPGHTHMECDADHAAIERKSKRAPFPIHVPRDWYNLVRLSGKKHNFEVVVVDQNMIFDFTALTGRDGLFMKKKIDDQGNKFSYREVKWLKFEKSLGVVLYKKTLQKDHIFDRINFNKKKTGRQAAVLKLAYKEPIPISSKKKANLISLLPQVDQDVREFYENLDAIDMDKDIDPDLDRLLSETEDNDF